MTLATTSDSSFLGNHPLGLGTWQFGGTQWAGQEKEASHAAMSAALDAGISHFDTASAYGNGRSEEVIGGYLTKNPSARERLVLGSKHLAGPCDRQKFGDAINQSLERLGVEHLDIYYIHWPKSDKDMRPVMEALEQARADGRIARIGVSNFSVDQMRQISDVGRIDLHQVNLSLLWRFDETNGKLDYCRDNGIDLVTYSSLAQGILTGKFGPERPSFPDGDSRDSMLLFREGVWPKVHQAVEQMKEVADEVGRPLTHLALQWVSRQPGVRSVLVGVRGPEQLERNAEAFAGDPVPDSAFDDLTRISSELMTQIPDEGNVFNFHP